MRDENAELQRRVQELSDLVDDYKAGAAQHARALGVCRKDSAQAQQRCVTMAEQHRLETQSLRDDILDLTTQLSAMQRDEPSSARVRARLFVLVC